MSFLTFQEKQISGIPAGKACNLAIRNAWFAGCVEWDCGRCRFIGLRDVWKELVINGDSKDWRTRYSPIKNFIEKSLKHFGISAIHGIGVRRFCHNRHPEMVKPIVIGYQTALNFAEGVLSRNLRIKTSQKLLTRRKCLAVIVTGQIFNSFSKRCPGIKLKSC